MQIATAAAVLAPVQGPAVPSFSDLVRADNLLTGEATRAMFHAGRPGPMHPVIAARAGLAAVRAARRAEGLSVSLDD